MAHITIEETFRTQLDLSGNDLIVYSLIYGFSQQQNGVFYGSRTFIQFWLGCKSLRTVDLTIARLVESGLIEKVEYYEGAVRRCAYRIVKDPCNIYTGAKSASVQNLPKTGAKSAHNSLIDSNNNTHTSDARAKKLQIAEFVSMTEAEYQKLLDKFGKEDTDELVEILDNAKGSKGYKYKSDYRAILSWCVTELEERKRKRGAFAQPQYQGGPRMNSRGETPTVASMRAAQESFDRIARRHSTPSPAEDQLLIEDDQL